MNVSLASPLFQIKYWLIFLLSISFSNTYAQKSDILDAYIQTAIANNAGIQQQALEIQKSRELVRQSKALSKLNLSFDANYTMALGGRKLDFPIGDLLNPVYSTLNQLTQSNVFLPVKNAEIQFLPNNFHETKISFAYPLYNTDLKYNKSIQGHLLASKTALKSAQEQALGYDITTVYVQYLQALEAEKVWQNTRIVLLEFKRFNESLVKNNVATKDIIATAEYELSKADNEIFNYQTKQHSAKAYFNYLVSSDLQQPIQIDTNLLHVPVAAYKLDDLINQLPQRRQEFSVIESLISAAETNIKRNIANQKLPDLYLGGSLGFQGFGYKFNAEQAYALAQVGLKYSLYDGGLQKSKTQETRLENRLARNQLTQVQQQIALEVTTAWNDLEASRFAFLSSQKNVEAAKAIFKIVNNKYRAGQALLLEFLDAQNRVTTAQLQLVLTAADALLKEAHLKKAAGI